MIHDVDASLRALVSRDALNGSDVDLAFEAPTREWAAHRNKPTVDIYLYDIREDVERRQVAWEPVRDENGRVTERRPPPRQYRRNRVRPAPWYAAISFRNCCIMEKSAGG